MERASHDFSGAQFFKEHHLDPSVVQRLKEQQQSLKHFVREWSLQQDQILQAISQSVQEQTSCDSITQAEAAPNAEIGFEEAVHREHSVNSLPGKKPAFRRSGSTCSDVLRVTRAPNSLSLRGRALERTSTAEALQEMMASLTHIQKRVDLQTLVSSHWFEGLCSVCIVINAALIAYAADYAAQNLESPTSRLVDAWERGFTVWYTLELFLRILAYRLNFFRGADWMWNAFDTVLVVNAIYDQVADLTAAQQGTGGNVVFLRVVRLMKMLKLLRMVRIMRMFKELRLIVTSIKGSLKSMFWAILLILIITYIVGICFLQAGTTYLQESGKNLSEEEIATIKEYWGRLSMAMLSLYMASTNGTGWKEMANSLIPVGYPFYMLFLLYIAFFMFVVMNTLTSLFIEATISNAEKDNHMLIRTELQKRSAYLQRAEELFQKMDQDESGDISEEEFRKHADDPEMLAFASSLELDVSDIAQFYSVLSCRGKYPVDMDTFVVGCLKLKGSARSLDLMGLIATEARSSRIIDNVADSCDRILRFMHDNVPRRHGKLNKFGQTEHHAAGIVSTI